MFVQPTWQRVAPDPTPEAPVVPSAPPAPSVPLAPAARQQDPSWPTSPQWPSTATPTAGLPFLNRPAAPEGGLEALWALSNQEVQTRQAPGKPASAIQPCVSCGLSLSANARFCRRCGALQGG